MLLNISVSDAWMKFRVYFNQMVSIVNTFTNGNTVSDGTITLNNTNKYNNNITLNVASGMISGDGGALSNLNPSKFTTQFTNAQLQNNNIQFVSGNPLLSFTNSAVPLGGSTTLNTNYSISSDISDTNIYNLASSKSVNTAYNYIINITNLFNGVNNAANTIAAAYNKSNNVLQIVSGISNTNNILLNYAVTEVVDIANSIVTIATNAANIANVFYLEANNVLNIINSSLNISILANNAGNIVSNTLNFVTNFDSSSRTPFAYCTFTSSGNSILNTNNIRNIMEDDINNQMLVYFIKPATLGVINKANTYYVCSTATSDISVGMTPGQIKQKFNSIVIVNKGQEYFTFQIRDYNNNVISPTNYNNYIGNIDFVIYSYNDFGFIPGEV